jgi:predicted O-methyltransferase YrrM
VKSVSAEYPWLQPAAIAWLVATLRPEWRVLETGAGGSTVFFARRARYVVSYESDVTWYERVQQQLRERSLDENAELHLAPRYPVLGLLGEEGPYNLVFIDGRGRVKSAETALPLIVPGGWLMLDDSDRERYGPIHKMLGDRPSIEFRDGADRTTVWQLL